MQALMKWKNENQTMGRQQLNASVINMRDIKIFYPHDILVIMN